MAKESRCGANPGGRVSTSLIILTITKYYKLKDLYINSENVPEHRSVFAEAGERGDKKFPHPPSLDYVNPQAATGEVVGSARRDDVS